MPKWQMDKLSALVLFFLPSVWGQSSSSTVASRSQTQTSYRAIKTLPASINDGVTLLPNLFDPQAINPQDVCPGYMASNIARTKRGLTARLTLAGTACNVYGTDVTDLNLTVEYQAQDRLNIYITPTYVNAANSSWFVLPAELVPKPIMEQSGNMTVPDSDLLFSYSNSPTFSFQVIRQSNGDQLFNTNGSKLVFEDQFVEFASTLPEDYNLYGLGEVITNFRLGNNYNRTIYAADVGDPPDYNLYGSQTFYLDTRYFSKNASTGVESYVANASINNGDYVSYSHGVFLRNAHAQELLLRSSNVTWRTIGGSIDLYFYSGPTQKKVTESYQKSTIGLPGMQQYFTFGYHQCRWGYQNWSVLQDVVNTFKAFNLPLETTWSDIDYMNASNQYRDFENDQNTFPYDEGVEFLDSLHSGGRHYIPIVDSAVYIPNPNNASDAYPTFDRGNATDSFMLNPDGSLYIGDVWPGYTVFPDWIGASLNGTGAFDWWTGELSRYHANISYDGIWIDMSEVSSFCVGSCGSDDLASNPVHPFFSLPGESGPIVDYPEGFALTNASQAAAVSSSQSAYLASVSSASAASATSVLSSTYPAAASTSPTMTTSTSTSYLRTQVTPGVRNINYPPYVINNVQGVDLANHAASPNATHHGGIQDYDVHNLFGHQILNATYNALLSVFPGKRPFILGRSTFAGSGKWAAHWGGDNASKFYYMAASIPQALSFSLFGIPMFGVDTCGFNGNSDEELCNRWMQLSAFFSFYRNHNVLAANPQEPYVWASVAEASRIAMNIRYLLLPYIYTTFYQANTAGSTFLRALSWEFPNDPTLASADRQFLMGDSILVTPVLLQGYTNVSGVFPGYYEGEIWYDWYNQTALPRTSQNVTIAAPLGHIPVYIRGGKVLPTQQPALTTRDSRLNPWGLIVTLSASGTASGSLYIDDGVSLSPNATLNVEFSTINSTLTASGYGTWNDTCAMGNVTVLGVKIRPTAVRFNGAMLGSGWNYNGTSQVLQVGLMNYTSGGAYNQDWTLSWK